MRNRHRRRQGFRVGWVNRQRILWAIIGLAVGFVAGVVLEPTVFPEDIGSRPATGSSRTNASATPTPNIVGGLVVQEVEEGGASDKPIRVSARDLYREYESNPVRFREKYSFGQWVKISGKVRSIGDDHISLEEMRPSGSSSYALTGFTALRVENSDQGRELILSASIGKSLSATCFLDLQGTGPGEVYHLELCRAP